MQCKANKANGVLTRPAACLRKLQGASSKQMGISGIELQAWQPHNLDNTSSFQSSYVFLSGPSLMSCAGGRAGDNANNQALCGGNWSKLRHWAGHCTHPCSGTSPATLLARFRNRQQVTQSMNRSCSVPSISGNSPAACLPSHHHNSTHMLSKVCVLCFVNPHASCCMYRLIVSFWARIALPTDSQSWDSSGVAYCR